MHYAAPADGKVIIIIFVFGCARWSKKLLLHDAPKPCEMFLSVMSSWLVWHSTLHTFSFSANYCISLHENYRWYAIFLGEMHIWTGSKTAYFEIHIIHKKYSNGYCTDCWQITALCVNPVCCLSFCLKNPRNTCHFPPWSEWVWGSIAWNPKRRRRNEKPSVKSGFGVWIDVPSQQVMI